MLLYLKNTTIFAFIGIAGLSATPVIAAESSHGAPKAEPAHGAPAKQLAKAPAAHGAK